MSGMIEQTTVGGRPATVAYITRGFEPATKATAELIKVLFNDERGGSMFLDAKPVEKKFDPKQPRDRLGRWKDAPGNDAKTLDAEDINADLEGGGSFSGPLESEPTGEQVPGSGLGTGGEIYRLTAPLSYTDRVTGLTITVPEGYETDMASIPPQWLPEEVRSIPSNQLPLARAGVIHDYLYTSHAVPTRRQADQIFLRALADLGVPLKNRLLMYAAVRLGAGEAWDARLGWGVEKFDPNQPRVPAGQTGGGRWTDGSGGGALGATFVSPSVSDQTFDTAMRNLQGERHRMMAKAVADINRELGLHANSQVNVVGAWQDGAEDAFMLTTYRADWDTLRAAAAMQGYLADQKSALIFQSSPDGGSVLAEFHATGDLATIHQNLLADGLANHTLIPGAGGARVIIVDVGGQNGAAITQGANRYGSQVSLRRGRAEFIGTELQTGSDRDQRDDARRAYSRVLSQFASSSGDDGGRWNRIRSRWQPSFDAIKAQIAKLLRERAPLPRRRLS